MSAGSASTSAPMAMRSRRCMASATACASGELPRTGIMRLTFRAKLLGSHVGLVAAVLLIVIFELNRTLGADLRQQLDQRLEQQAEGVAQWVSAGRHPDRLAGRLAAVVGAKVTILDRNGAVLGDSAPEETPSTDEASKPEVLAAREGRVGHATRLSARSLEEMHYVA